MAPAMFVIGKCFLTLTLKLKGDRPWFWCACSACPEKPKETKWSPLCIFGSKTFQHGTLAGASSVQQLRFKDYTNVIL